MKTGLDNTIAYGFIGLIVFSALAHGAVEPWSELVFIIWIVALGMIWAVKSVREKRLLVYVPQTIWPLAAFTFLAVTQSFDFGSRTGSPRSLSSDVESTRGAALMLGCLFVAGLLAANFLAYRERLQRLTLFLTIFGMVLATFALIQHFTWNERFYWFRAVQTETPFGPFVNRNHFAGYIELLLPWPVIVMMTRYRRAEKVFYGFAAAWMAMTAIFSLSRGGMISIFAELMFLAAFSPRDKADYATDYTGNRRFGNFLLRVGALGAIIFATVSGVTWLGAERVTNRIATGQESEQPAAAISSAPANNLGSRVELWRDSWELFRARPLIGSGLGTFETVFPAYNRQNNTGLVVSQTHNDYLQVLTDGGIIGGAIAVWFLIATGLAVWRGLRTREPMMNLYVLGCGAGIFGLLVHSLFDFNLQLPSHALLFVTFSAITAQLCELATVIAAARTKARPIADAKRILLTRRKQEV